MIRYHIRHAVSLIFILAFLSIFSCGMAETNSTANVQGCYALENVLLPEGLKRIGAAAFKDCQNLREVNIPNSLVEIGEDTFSGCNQLGVMQFSKIVHRSKT